VPTLRVVPVDGLGVLIAGLVVLVTGFVGVVVVFVVGTVVGLPVTLSINIFVPAPIIAPVPAFKTLLVIELLVPVDFEIVGLVLTLTGVVLVAGVVGVLVVIVGLVVAGLLVKVVRGAKEVLGTEEVFVVKDGAGLVTVEVKGRLVEEVKGLEVPKPPSEVIDVVRPPEIDGALPPPRITLSSGER
tara:strand:- start:2477 stop:3034 length:558 start_codon:yes stop_codon:yes gene_type:complete